MKRIKEQKKLEELPNFINIIRKGCVCILADECPLSEGCIGCDKNSKIRSNDYICNTKELKKLYLKGFI